MRKTFFLLKVFFFLKVFLSKFLNSLLTFQFLAFHLIIRVILYIVFRRIILNGLITQALFQTHTPVILLIKQFHLLLDPNFSLFLTEVNKAVHFL